MNLYDDENLSYVPAEEPIFNEAVESISYSKEPLPAEVEDDSADEYILSVSSEEVSTAQRLVEHSQRLEEHEEKIDWLLDKFKPENQNKPVFWSWRHAEGEQRLELWHEVADFVGWVNEGYFVYQRSKQIRPCWYQHPDVVEELTGLWAAWWDVTHNAKKPNSGLAKFHRELFWPTLERVWESMKSCDSGGGHTRYGGTVRADDEGMEEFFLQDVRSVSDGARE